MIILLWESGQQVSLVFQNSSQDSSRSQQCSSLVCLYFSSDFQSLQVIFYIFLGDPTMIGTTVTFMSCIFFNSQGRSRYLSNISLFFTFLSLRVSDYCLHLYCYFHKLRTTSFIETTGVACSDSVSHKWVQVLSIPVLLLACSGDWTCNLQMIVSLEAWGTNAYNCYAMCPAGKKERKKEVTSQFNGCFCKKWNRQPEFKFWKKLFEFHFLLMPLGKIWIHLFSTTSNR